jgi:hypothetical protein
MSTLTRQEVYSLIDGERAYQDSLGADRTEDHGFGITQGEELVLIRAYLRKAEDAWTNNPGASVDACAANLRKIAAMCVRAMERYGAPAR